MLTALNHLTLAVIDLSRSVDFYRECLGLRLVARWDQGAYLELGEAVSFRGCEEIAFSLA